MPRQFMRRCTKACAVTVLGGSVTLRPSRTRERDPVSTIRCGIRCARLFSLLKLHNPRMGVALFVASGPRFALFFIERGERKRLSVFVAFARTHTARPESRHPDGTAKLSFRKSTSHTFLYCSVDLGFCDSGRYVATSPVVHTTRPHRRERHTHTYTGFITFAWG